VRVVVPEHHGRGGHGGGGLAGDVGARSLAVHLVRLPRRRHVLRPLPAVVVRVAVAHLDGGTGFISSDEQSIIFDPRRQRQSRRRRSSRNQERNRERDHDPMWKHNDGDLRVSNRAAAAADSLSPS
jgi:hypothetical protein